MERQIQNPLPNGHFVTEQESFNSMLGALAIVNKPNIRLLSSFLFPPPPFPLTLLLTLPDPLVATHNVRIDQQLSHSYSLYTPPYSLLSKYQ